MASPGSLFTCPRKCCMPVASYSSVPRSTPLAQLDRAGKKLLMSALSYVFDTIFYMFGAYFNSKDLNRKHQNLETKIFRARFVKTFFL